MSDICLHMYERVCPICIQNCHRQNEGAAGDRKRMYTNQISRETMTYSAIFKVIGKTCRSKIPVWTISSSCQQYSPVEIYLTRHTSCNTYAVQICSFEKYLKFSQLWVISLIVYDVTNVCEMRAHSLSVYPPFAFWIRVGKCFRIFPSSLDNQEYGKM
jgi:hypothetical protein